MLETNSKRVKEIRASSMTWWYRYRYITVSNLFNIGFVTALLRPPASHITKHPSNLNKICGALMEVLVLSEKLCADTMQSKRPIRSDIWLIRVARKYQETPCCQHDLMVMMLITKKKWFIISYIIFTTDKSMWYILRKFSFYKNTYIWISSKLRLCTYYYMDALYGH